MMRPVASDARLNPHYKDGVPMGLTHASVVVRNPAAPQQKWEGRFLVDTGATDCMAPARHLREIGLEPVGSRSYELADGTELRVDIGVAQIEVFGEVAGGVIIFGPDDADPILGVTALESLGILVDPNTQQLVRLPAVPLKGFGNPKDS